MHNVLHGLSEIRRRWDSPPVVSDKQTSMIASATAPLPIPCNTCGVRSATALSACPEPGSQHHWFLTRMSAVIHSLFGAAEEARNRGTSDSVTTF